jgi:hypothetical protein
VHGKQMKIKQPGHGSAINTTPNRKST